MSLIVLQTGHHLRSHLIPPADCPQDLFIFGQILFIILCLILLTVFFAAHPLTSEKDINTYLTSIYFNPQHPASYSGAPAVYSAVKKEGKYKISLKNIKKWLADQEAYAIFKPARKTFARPRVVVSAKDQMWDCDCLSMKYYKSDNRDFSYILVCIDVFTRFLFTRPLKALRGIQVRDAYTDIFELNEKPQTIRTDHGSEFVNKDMKIFFNEININIISQAMR